MNYYVLTLILVLMLKTLSLLANGTEQAGHFDLQQRVFQEGMQYLLMVELNTQMD